MTHQLRGRLPEVAFVIPWHERPWPSTRGPGRHCAGCGWPADWEVTKHGLPDKPMPPGRRQKPPTVTVCGWCLALEDELRREHESRYGHA